MSRNRWHLRCYKGVREVAMLPTKKSNPLRQSGIIYARETESLARSAGCVFVRGTASGWSRRDLAAWLVCHYAPATAQSPGAAAHRGLGSDAVDDALLEEIILDARTKTLRLLADLAFPSLVATRARELIAHGSVTRMTGDGGAVHVPVSLARLRLHERVESLFIADWLNSPSDYRTIELCRPCGALGFDHRLPKHEVWCPEFEVGAPLVQAS